MLLPSLALAATANAHALQCGTPAALDALRGHGPATHSAMLAPPARMTPDGASPPPSRTHHGTPWDNHHETAHFSINWEDPTLPDADVMVAAEALELGWQAFVEEQDWPQPVSSDQYYIWVVLDPSLGSTTGFTTEWFSDAYPDGYPAIYINPTVREAYGDAFYTALSTHELMHAIQYAMRDYSTSGSNSENWFWEASATHASELAAPENDGHQYLSAGYADHAAERYDSYEGYHHYGMFVFNAWLEHSLGANRMRAVWVSGSERPGQPWPTILEAATDVPAPVLWADFTEAYGNRSLPESRLYAPVVSEGVLTDGAGATGLHELGTHYWSVDRDADLAVSSGDVILGGAPHVGSPITVRAGDVVSVTALADDTDYVLELAAPGALTADDTSTDSGQPDTDVRTDDGLTGDASAQDKGGCAAIPATGGLALVGLALFRRRRLSP